MTFLALTPFEAAVLALLTTGTIVALYFLKLRHRRVVISSSILWKRIWLVRGATSAAIASGFSHWVITTTAAGRCST